MKNNQDHEAQAGQPSAHGKGTNERNENPKTNRFGARWVSTFKGETAEMNGNVFQLQSEKARKGQFDDTMEALQRYSAKVYPKDSVFLLPLFKELKQPTVKEPDKPGTGSNIKKQGESVDKWDKMLYLESVKMYLKTKERTTATLTSLYGIVWGQCSRLMQNKCRNDKDFEEIEEKCDVVRLLKIIKNASHELESNTCVWDALSQAKRRFYAYKQADHEPNAVHVKNLKNLFSVIEYYDGNMFEDEVLMNSIKEDATNSGESIDDAECKRRVKNKCLALELVNSSKWRTVIEDIRTQFLYKNDIYPKDLTEAFELLEYHSKRHGKKQGKRSKSNSNPPNNEDVVQGAQYATQNRNTKSGTKGSEADMKEVTCYYCKAQGHYANECPLREDKIGETHLTKGEASDDSDRDAGDKDLITSYCYHLDDLAQHDEDSILIDTGSTVSIFNNEEMLTNVREVSQTMRAITNGGHQDSNKKGILPGFFPVWVNPHSRLNILAWSDIRRKFRITADTAESNEITVHLENDRKMKFEEVKSGLYLCKAVKDKLNKDGVTEYSCYTLVADNRALFTKRQVDSADLARRLYQHLGMPGYRKFFQMIKHNHIKNCPLTLDDARRALKIYGPDIAHLKGKGTRPKAGRIEIRGLTPLPQEVLDNQRYVNLSMDYFYVQGVPVLHTISRNFHFRTVEFLLNKSKATEEETKEGVGRIMAIYHARKLEVSQVNADNEFECIEDLIRPANLHLVGANEHVGDVERSVRTIKECTRCHVHRLPYKYYPKIMVTGMVTHVVKSLNQLLSETGINNT